MSGTLANDPCLTSWTGLGCRIDLMVTDADDLAVARAAVDLVIEEIDRTLSRFREDSELSRLNRAAETAVAVSPLFARALRVALDAADWTDGLVDPTIGQHLLDLGYDRTFSLVPLVGSQLTVTGRPTTSYRSVRIDGDDDAATVHRPDGIRLDLGATGKGLAADLAADACSDAGVRGVLVNLGGDVSVSGEPPEGGWPVFVTDDSTAAAAGPESPVASGQTVALTEGALATSGTSRRRWRRGGLQIHHILDPATGFSARTPWRTVSVAASTCALANAAATAAVIRGHGAVGWLTRTGLAARLVSESGEVVRVGGWPA